MIPEKGPFVLLESLSILRSQSVEFRAVFAGAASYKEFEADFTRSCARYDLTSRVTWIGACYGAEKVAKLSEADVFVMPTFYPAEGLPLVLLEAMSFGLPVVATDHAAIPDVVVDGHTGYLVPTRDSCALADKLRLLINTPGLRTRLGRAGRERFLRYFTRERFEEGLLSIFREAESSAALPKARFARADAGKGETGPQNTAARLRLAIFQHQVPEYRIGIFERLAREHDLDVTIYAARYSGQLRGIHCVPLSELRVWQLMLHPVLFSSEFFRKHDVVLCEGRLALAASVTLGLMQRALRLPVVWWTSLWRPDGKIDVPWGPRGFVVRRILRACRSVATYSETAAEAVVRAGVERDHVFIAYNSLDTELLNRVEQDWRSKPEELSAVWAGSGLQGKRVALFVGRLTKGKRIQTLLDAWTLVVERGWQDPPKLLIVGDGEERERIAARINNGRLSETVALLGEIRSYTDVCPYFLASRVFVLPGAGGLAINHALTHGVPAVVAGGDGTERDIIDEGRNGFLVPVGDAQALANRITTLLKSSDSDWMQFSEHARCVIRERAGVHQMIAGLVAAIRFAADQNAPIEARPPNVLRPDETYSSVISSCAE